MFKADVYLTQLGLFLSVYKPDMRVSFWSHKDKAFKGKPNTITIHQIIDKLKQPATFNSNIQQISVGNNKWEG